MPYMEYLSLFCWKGGTQQESFYLTLSQRYIAPKPWAAWPDLSWWDKIGSYLRTLPPLTIP